MQRTRADKVLTWAIWGVMGVAAAVCGLGAYITRRQLSDIEEVLLAAERRSADGQAPLLEAALARRESEALEALAAGREDAPLLEAALRHHAFIRQPFFIEADGTLSAPHLRTQTAATVLLGDEIPPPDFRLAAELAASRAPVDAKERALAGIYRSPAMAPSWRLRARGHTAAILSGAGRPAEAADVYAGIFEEFEMELCRGTPPTYLQLSLARAETLKELGRPADAALALGAAVERLDGQRLRASADEVEFFVRRARGLFQAMALASPATILAVQERAIQERLDLAAAERVRDFILDQIRLEIESPPSHIPERAPAGLAAPAAPVVWTRTSGALRPGVLLAVGFHHDPKALEGLLAERLALGAYGEPLEVDVGETDDPSLVTLSTLEGALACVRIGMRRERWAAVVSRARRPFVVAGALIATLGVVLAASLVILWRTVSRELALSRLKTEFVANVSHELKTPLALIRLCGETLQLDRLKGKEQEHKYYKVITREAERLTHLINNVLDFASIEAGRKSYRLAPCDLADVVRQTLDSYRLTLDENGFEVRQDVPPHSPPVAADEAAVTQALINLLQNAVRYSRDRKRLWVTLSPVGREVRISVRDEGVGIAREEQERVWEDFYRTREARALGTRGSGLGLSVVRHIMESHHGRVELESKLGEGSEFTLVFPVATNGDGGAHG